MKNKLLIVSISVILTTIFSNCTPKVFQGDLLLQNINIINIESGKIDLSMDVLISADTISNIYKNGIKNNYSVKSVIEGKGKFLIPGLWDMHVHSWDFHEHYAPLLLANGIVGVREMNGNLQRINELKKNLEEKKYNGPIIISSGPIIDGHPPSQKSFVVASTPEEGRSIVREQKSQGADFIKVYFGLEESVYLAIADECKKLGLTMAGHLPNKVSLELSVEVGHQTYDHLYNVLARISDSKGLEEMESSRKGAYTGDNFVNRVSYTAKTYNPSKVDTLYNVLTSNGQRYICPTFTMSEGKIRLRDTAYIGDYRKNYLPWVEPKDRSEYFTKNEFEYKRNLEIWYLEALKLVKPLSDKGVKFLAGTDYPMWFCYPGFSLHEELEILVEKAGLSELEALQTATINPAEFLRLSDKYGTIKSGKNASLLILNKNPLDNIKNTHSIEGLILEGEYFNRQKLDSFLESRKRKE